VVAALDRADVHHQDAIAAVRALSADETALLLSMINYAEALVRPAEKGRTLRAAISAIDAMGLRLVAPTAPVAREAARLLSLNVSLADGFALATARAHGAWIATFDRRVRRSAEAAGVELAPALI
jgi:predicted nucleic acid-binding protein